MYYIYEIPGVKIGCTRDDMFNARQTKQRDKGQMIILEEHDDIYVASDREIVLQKERGYSVDIVPYWKIHEMNQLPKRKNIEGCKRGGETISIEQLKIIGKVGGVNSALSPIHNTKVKVKCPHCDYENTAPTVGRHIKYKH